MRITGKRILSLLVCLVLQTALFPLPAVEAASAKVLASGKCGYNVTWTLTDDAVLTISGTGSMNYFHTPQVEGYNGPDAPWYVWGGDYVAIKEVVIESGVTSIGGYAFYSCHNLTKVTIPESVTSIDKYAFIYCYNLSHITIPASVKTIGKNAFAGCKGLSSITFLGDAPTLETDCFEDVTATIYYPCTKKWDNAAKGNCSGTLTWAGHVYSDYAITQAATCTENALAVGTCPDCGATADITVPESATGHSFDQKGICTACSEQISLTVDLVARPYYNGGGFDYASVTVYADGQSLGSVSVDTFEYDYPREHKTFPYSPHKTYTFVWTSYPYYDYVFFAYFLGDQVLTYGYPEYQSIGKVSYTIERTEEHQYERVTTPATCTTQGSIADICTICGTRTKISTIPATGHSYTSQVTTAPTCTGEGVRTFRCSVCDASYTESVPAAGHRYDAEGVCVDCGVEFEMFIYMTDTYGDSWNGSAIEVYTGDTLLTEVSLTKGALNGEAEVPFVHGQTYQLKWKSSACDNECGFKVTLNGEILVSGQGSNYADGQILCTFETPCAHVYQTVVTPPTCTEEGFTTGTCTICGYSDIIDTTPAAGHRFVDGICTVCGQEEGIANGSCGEDLQWRLYDNGTLIISGTGPMENYSIPEDGSEPNTPWYSYKPLITNVIIEAGATSIGEYTFHGCQSLTDITIPESVTTIGKLAFYNCTGLTDVIFPKGVTTIGSAAFRRCGNLINITIPDSVTDIGKIAFFDCTGLKEVTIPESVTTIGEYAFGNCTGLTTITFSGTAPTMSSDCLRNVTATAIHPCNDKTWTDTVKQSYGGTIAWKANHSFGDYTPDENATCTEDGTASRSCSTCGTTETMTLPDTATGHTAGTIPGIAATCTKTGLTDGVKCAVCNAVLIPQQTIPVAEHTQQTIPGYAATCTGTGLTDGVKCTVCNEVLTPQQIIPVAEHNYLITKVPVTCTDYGYEFYQCQNCDDSFYNRVIAPTGHLYESGICTVCGQEEITCLPGDLNGDGQRSIADVAMLYAHIQGTALLDSGSLLYADINGDGTVNIADTARLYAHVNGTKPLN